jgi:tetratricopeptide (TPR) repeat protein
MEITQGKEKSICLNMIVKDECEIIIETLDNLCKFFNFSYWVICDTGSQDNTKEIIREYFLEKGISGELIEDVWVDFAYNRTRALNAAFNKTDYLLMADADDRIYNNLKLPNLILDQYSVRFGTEFTYYRPILLSNRRKWKYIGILHECLQYIGDIPSQTKIDGDYYFGIGTFGSRSKDPDKYLKDANLLEQAFEIEEDKTLRGRYAFYCAQSYLDADETNKAVDWYLKILILDNWVQEKYYACLKLGFLYKKLGDGDKMIEFWTTAYKYDTERVDCVTYLMEYFYNKGNHFMVNALHTKCKNYNMKNPETKLFLLTHTYDTFEYLNSISAFYVGDFVSGYESCKKLFERKAYLEITIQNLRFYDKQMDIDTDDNIVALYSDIDNIRTDTDINSKFDEKTQDILRSIWERLFKKI